MTKDNLLKRGWKGSKQCIFCGQDETIDHLFFKCSGAVLIWNLLKYAFDLNAIPDSLTVCFGSWLRSFPKENKILVLVVYLLFSGLFGSVETMLFLKTKPMLIH